jgi:holo-[acyl-carrier protein] synthase
VSIETMSIGIDIIEIPRIKKACERYGRQFMERILTEREIEYCLSKANPYESIAARFACKEAFSKAVGTGITEHFGWHSIEIVREKSGKPIVKLSENAMGITAENVSLSMSHTHHYAVAVVTITS